MGQYAVQGYTEYNAWLQPAGLQAGFSLRLAAAEVPLTVLQECETGLRRLYGADIWQQDAKAAVQLALDATLPAEGYRIAPGADGGVQVQGADNAGLLYGVFALQRALATGKALADIREESAPRVARRVMNHWDNITGNVERGYAGGSLFFKDGAIDYDAVRVRDYARLLASVGINVVAVNNVNVLHGAEFLVSDENLEKQAELAAIFREYGVRYCLSVNFESPVIVGGLPTADPLDPAVVAWWEARTRAIYKAIPDFSGFLVKADSEFRGGPAALGRTQADGANMLARAVAPYGGVVYWRCFIYNCMQDWRDTGIDRPKAPYDLFVPQDGTFEPNVILQVKNGPSDFQVREPVSPLLGAMKHTRQSLEFQVTQEYTGQQIDIFNLAVQWQEVFDAPMGGGRQLRQLMGKEIDTVAGVANVGLDENWTGHTLAQANLYAFGRLAWNPALTAEEITAEWVAQSFGRDQKLTAGLMDIMMRSRYSYEKYTTPLGLCWMVSISHHYGPSPEGYEFMKWGTYHRANHVAVGVERGSKGTGMVQQYAPDVAAMYEDIATCPEDLLLYFHRLPYDYVLQNGKTLLQHYYDCHFEGAADVEDFIRIWEGLQPLLPPVAYASVLQRLMRQLENAREWRDVVNTYFYRMTGIPDEKGRKIYE